MDYFKSAASAFLAKGGPLPGYTLGDRDAWYEGRTMWSLHSAIKRDDGTPCSVFVFDAMLPSHNPRRSLLPLAKNALRRFRTVRHPDVVKFLDSAETPTAIYIVVESIRPLGKVLEDMSGERHQREEWVCWGLSKIANAVRFLNTDMGTTHGNLRTDAIFLASSGEWRLGGLELMSSLQDEAPVLYNMGNLVPDATRFAPPEVKQQGWSILRELACPSADSWSFSLIVVEAYNGSLPPVVSGIPAQGRIPDAQYKLLRRMTLPNAKARLPVAQYLEAGQVPGGFFSDNRLVRVASGLDGFMLAREEERADIIRQVKTSASSFPPDFLQHKVLPALISAVGLASANAVGSASAAPAGRILPVILQLGEQLSDQEWSKSVAPTVLKAFSSPDRSIRMTLLETLPQFSPRFDAKQVSDKIWPNLLTGFGDSAPAIREATVKSILSLSDKLSDRILNNDLLRQLARTQVDNEPSIRTNTAILLGNLAPKLSTQTHKKVLIPAFVRSLRDPFVHARNAGIMAFLATSERFDGEDSAKHILPAMCPCLVDPEKIVRDQAKAAVAAFLAKAEQTAADMKASAIPEAVENDHGLGSPRNGAVPSTAAGAASLLSRYTDTLYSFGASSSATQSAAAIVDESSARSSVEKSAPEWSKGGDLMDVQDDDDDWTGFESAETPSRPIELRRPVISRAAHKPLGKDVLSAAARKAEGKARPGVTSSVGSLQSALQKSSLAVAVGSTDDDAWDEEQTSMSVASEVQPIPAAPSVAPDIAIEVPQTPSPASAFAAKAPWDSHSRSATPSSLAMAEPVAAGESQTEWTAMGDIDSGDEGTSGKSSAMLGAVAPKSKEQKRLEMERRREERRARMAQLKQSKATKIVSDFA